jgi:VWFA-related protein
MKASLSRRIFLQMAAAGAVSTRVSRSQESAASSSDAKFSTDVKVVNVLVAVRDKQGKIINTLGKDDFDLAEEGRPQTIRYFTRETDAPLTLGLLVDTSLSQRRVLGEEKDASRRFIEKVLREDRDQTFLIHFDHDTELLQDLTSSPSKLEHALDDVQLPDDARPQMRGGGGGGGYPGGGGGGYPGGGRRGGQAGTTMYDAVQLASDELMRKRMGRKALILLTDGVDNGSKDTLSQAIEAAQRTDTLVYSIWFTGDEQQQTQPYFGNGGGYGRHRGGGGFPPPRQEQRPDGRKILQQISRETGGGYYEVGKKLSIDQIYDRIEEELRNQYNLGFTPDKADSFGFHKIAVTVKQKGLIVQTREGYYPGS